MKGQVAWFNSVKSFGFIRPQGGGEDFFVHYSEIKMDGFKTLEQGQRVTFDSGTDEKTGRTVAKNVVPLPMTPTEKEELAWQQEK